MSRSVPQAFAAAPPVISTEVSDGSPSLASHHRLRASAGVAAQAQQQDVRRRVTRMALGPILPTLHVLRVRDFRLLFGGQLISVIGDQFYVVALPWLILSDGGSPQELGLVLSCYGVPRIATLLWGGILSDRTRPRRVMLVADSVRALLVGALALVALWGHPPSWLLCAFAFGLGVFAGLFRPAAHAIMPDLLDRDDVQVGNSITASSASFARLVGPAVGGVVVGTARIGIAFAVDALSFVVSAVTLMAIGHGARAQRQQGAQRPAASARLAPTRANGIPSETTTTHSASGNPNATRAQSATARSLWRLLTSSPELQILLLFTGLVNLTSGGVLEVALPTLARDDLRAGATGFGFLLVALSIGALVGGIATGWMARLQHRGVVLLILGLLEGGCLALVPLVGTSLGLQGAALALGGLGIANGVDFVLTVTILQHLFPREVLGRVMSLLMLAVYGLYPLSVALAGLVATQVGPAMMFFAAGLSIFVAVAIAWSQPAFRRL